MPVKIENKATVKLPKNAEEVVQSVLDTVPREHLRGLNRIVFVDQITPDPRLLLTSTTNLPGLYHPKRGMEQPWCEISLSALLPAESFFKRLAARLNFKANLAYLLLSLQAQHYHFTLTHGIKKHQYEGKIRAYTDKYHEVWREQQTGSGWRAKLFKPLRPYLDRWVKKLRKRYEEEQRNAKSKA